MATAAATAAPCCGNLEPPALLNDCPLQIGSHWVRCWSFASPRAMQMNVCNRVGSGRGRNALEMTRLTQLGHSGLTIVVRPLMLVLWI
jgi:hypothetical protein